MRAPPRARTLTASQLTYDQEGTNAAIHASARFIQADPVSGPAPSSQPAVSAPSLATASPSSSSQFDWGDAGIGAAAATALMGSGTLVLSGRRRRGGTARAS